MAFKSDPLAESIPSKIRTPGRHRGWLEAARGARRTAAMIRGFAGPNTRCLYDDWARSLEREADEILERVRLYTGKAENAAPRHFSAKGIGIGVVLAEKDEK